LAESAAPETNESQPVWRNEMSTSRKVEIFSTGCPRCEEAVELVNRIACPSCEVEVVDASTGDGKARAERAGATSTPAVAVDGSLASCCAGGGVPSEAALRAVGVGTPLD
jgi:glutaredoxin 3